MAQHSKEPWSGIGYVGSRLTPDGGLGRLLSAQLTAGSAWSVLAAALLSQAQLPGGAMPFCVPLIAAALLLRRPALPMLVGCALGLLLRWEPITWLSGWQLGAGALLLLTVRNGWDMKPWKVSLAAGAVMLLPLPFVTRELHLVILCLAASVASCLMTPVFVRAILSVGLPRQALSMDDKLCCLLAVALLSLGGMWVSVETLSLGGALAALCVYAVAWTAGPGLALPAGALLGLALMTAGATFDLVGVLAVLGGIAGMLRGTRRYMPLTAGLIACGLTAYAQGGLAEIIRALPSVAAGGVLFAALPVRWLDAMAGLLEAGPPVQAPDASASAYVLSTYAKAMARMAQALPVPEKIEGVQPVELLACRLCTDCENQQGCWEGPREETLDLLEGVLSACADDAGALEIEQAARLKGCTRAGDLFDLAKGLVLSKARKEKEDARRTEARAWALEHLRGQARALSSLAERMGEDAFGAAQARAAIGAAMPALRGRPDALTVCKLGGKIHVWLDVQHSQAHLGRLEDALGGALGLSMEYLEAGSHQDALLFVERPRLKITVGRASMPIAGEEISGDSVLSGRLDAGRFMLALSDGMGSGRAANAESRSALELLLQALRAGYGRADALRTVNGLLVACRGDEMYATMDLCVVDMDSGEAALDKLGACPSFLLRAGKCKRIGGDALPMGILDAVRPRALAARLMPGDLLVLMSDGIVDAFGGDDASLLAALGGLTGAEHRPPPQRVADTLLRRAFERSGGTALDDMTVLAALVEEA